MAYTTINKSTDYFNTKLYTGDGNATNAITGVGFQPDWVWIKRRESMDHVLYDVVRGVTKNLHSNTGDAEDTQTDGLTAFGTDGFTVGDHSGVNGNGNNISTGVRWSGGSPPIATSNTDILTFLIVKDSSGVTRVYGQGNTDFS